MPTRTPPSRRDLGYDNRLTALTAAIETLTDVADETYAAMGETGWETTLTPGDPWVITVRIDPGHDNAAPEVARRLRLGQPAGPGWWDGTHGDTTVVVEVGA